MRRALAVLTLNLCSFAILAASAHASDATVTMNVTTDNFAVQNLLGQFASTDVPITYYHCEPFKTGAGIPCTISHKYSFAPKNMNIQLCIPSNAVNPPAALDGSCAQLLQTDSGDSCHTPNTVLGCPTITYKTYQPKCQWTTGSGSTSTWNWAVTYDTSSRTYTISCSQQGFSATTH